MGRNLVVQLIVCQGKFDVTDFIGVASERLIADSKADNGRESIKLSNLF